MVTDDPELEQLLQQVKQMFQSQKISPQSAELSEDSEDAAPSGYQAPIKGTFFNSGGFSTVSPNPRHPQGHMGVDMRAAGGTPIYPMAPGVVTNVGTNPKGGNVVNIQHADNVRTYYAHMATAKVHKGDKVDYNTVIGTVGTSGNAASTWPHLHFQVWKDNQIQDPAHFFSIPKYTNPDQKEKQQGQWVSEQARQEARQFNMGEHNANRRVAISDRASELVRIATAYRKLANSDIFKHS